MSFILGLILGYVLGVASVIVWTFWSMANVTANTKELE